MAHQEYFTNTTNGHKFILRQSNEGRWAVKCLAPPPDGEKVWPLLWEYNAELMGYDEFGIPNHVPLTEEQARKIYESYMG